MKRSSRWLSVMILFSAFVALIQASAPVPEKPPGKGWISIFNGKDLTGWKNNGQEKWVVDSGTILGESTVGKYGYLTTEKTYRDFIARLKFKGETHGNSGFFFHSKITGNSPETGPDIEGMQCEIDPTPGKHTGGLYESGGRGWVAQPTAEGEKALKSDDWNDLEVESRGNHIITRLNGTQIVDYTDPVRKFTDGVLGLQLHTGGGVKIRFEDIYVKELK